MLSVRRPMLVVVLNCWVTATNVTLCRSNNSMSLEKSDSDRVNRSILLDDDDIDLAFLYLCQ